MAEPGLFALIGRQRRRIKHELPPQRYIPPVHHIPVAHFHPATHAFIPRARSARIKF